MFDNDEDGKWIPSNISYYGEITFKIKYKKQ
jgi:hypothetical protein